MSEQPDGAAMEILREAMLAANRPFDHPMGGKAIVVPSDCEVEILPPIDKPLTHIKQTVELLDAASFVAYVTAFRTPHTRIFADQQALSFMAVMDYHEAEGAVPAYGHHVARYSPPRAKEWERWKAIDGAPISQVEFAHFLEENLVDIAEPDGADVLEVATRLEARRKVSFESATRLDNGANEFVYREDIEQKGGAKGTVRVPAHLMLSLPVFFGGPLYRIKAFLRYRINDGALKFAIQMHRAEYAVDDAFAAIRTEIDNGTGLPSLLGRRHG